jgi:uncharacterized membrane protein YkoI
MNEKTILKIFVGFCFIALVAIGGLLVSAVQQEPGEVITIETNGQLTEGEAIAIASLLASGEFQEAELEYVNGAYVYAVEFSDGDTETEVVLDAATGDIVKVEVEEQDSDEEEDEEIDPEELDNLDADVTEDEAEEIALNAVGGGEVMEIAVEKESGSYVYEVEVEYKGDEFEVVIDMETGEVLEIEEE